MANQVQKIMVIAMGKRDLLCQQESEQIMQQSALAWKAQQKQAIAKLLFLAPAALPILLKKGKAMGNQELMTRLSSLYLIYPKAVQNKSLGRL
jgi:hypothetical protein